MICIVVSVLFFSFVLLFAYNFAADDDIFMYYYSICYAFSFSFLGTIHVWHTHPS
jgi:hypothetical protein